MNPSLRRAPLGDDLVPAGGEEKNRREPATSS
jgi:hypothetical protein